MTYRELVKETALEYFGFEFTDEQFKDADKRFIGLFDPDKEIEADRLDEMKLRFVLSFASALAAPEQADKRVDEVIAKYVKRQ